MNEQTATPDRWGKLDEPGEQVLQKSGAEPASFVVDVDTKACQ